MSEHQDAMDRESVFGGDQIKSDGGVGSADAGVLDTLKSLRNSVEKLDANMSKQFDLYSLMSDHRNRAELMLTKVTDLLNRIYLLDAYSKKELSSPEVSPEVVKSMQKRIGALMNYAVKLTCSFGLTPIAPQIGEDFNPEEHLIVGTVDVPKADPFAGKIAACDHMGCIRSGRVTPAEVIVYKETDNGEVAV